MQAGLLRSTPRTTWLDLCAWNHLALLRARAVRRSDELVLAVGLVTIVLFRAGGESNAKDETHLLALHQHHAYKSCTLSWAAHHRHPCLPCRTHEHCPNQMQTQIPHVILLRTDLANSRSAADAVASLPPLPYAAMHALFLSSTVRHACTLPSNHQRVLHVCFL